MCQKTRKHSKKDGNEINIIKKEKQTKRITFVSLTFSYNVFDITVNARMRINVRILLMSHTLQHISYTKCLEM